MADNTTFITGAADGAFAEALNGIPPWATQKTAEDIEILLSKILGVQSKALTQAIKCCKGAGGDGSSNTKVVNDELDKLSRNIRRTNEEDSKRKKREKDDDKNSLGRKRRETDSSALWNKAMGAMVGSGAKILAIQKQYFTTSEDLFKSGVNLLNGNDTTTSSMMSLNQIVTLTGLRLSTFQKVVEKYTSSVNSIGINKFAKTLSLTTSKLISLGYSSEQQAELVGTLIESESSYADIRSKNERQLADDAIRLGNQMTRLSILTGQSSAQLQENLKSLAKNTDSTVVSAVYGEEAAKRMNVFASSFKDADIGAMFQKLASAVQPTITKTFQALAQAGQAPLAEEFTRIAQAARDGSISAEQAQKQTSDLAQKVNSTTLQNLALLSDKGVEGASETLSVISKLRAQGNTTSKANEKQVESAIQAQSSLSRFSSEFEKSRSLAERTFPLLEQQVDAVSKALEMFNNTIISATDTFSAQTRSWIGAGIEVFAGIALISQYAFKFSDSILNLGKSLGSLVGPVLAVAGAFAAGYAIGTVLYNLVSKFDWFNNIMDKMFSGLDHILQYIPGLSSDARERLASRSSIESSASAISQNSVISIPKEPAQTTIISPSAVPASPEKITENKSVNSSNALISAVPITKSPANNDINSMLTYQSSILVQILETSQNLVSVNRDILKYAKIHS